MTEQGAFRLDWEFSNSLSKPVFLKTKKRLLGGRWKKERDNSRAELANSSGELSNSPGELGNSRAIYPILPMN